MPLLPSDVIIKRSIGEYEDRYENIFIFSGDNAKKNAWNFIEKDIKLTINSQKIFLYNIKIDEYIYHITDTEGNSVTKNFWYAGTGQPDEQTIYWMKPDSWGYSEFGCVHYSIVSYKSFNISQDPSRNDDKYVMI